MMEIKDLILNMVIMNTQNGNRSTNKCIIPIPMMGMDKDLISNNDINTQNGNIITY